MIDKAFILCAGFGKRLRPHTLTTPKPLTPVNARSLLARTCDHLNEAGVQTAILNTHYLSEKVQEAASNLPIERAILSHEPDILDTGGGIVAALEHLNGQDFFVLSGDGLWENAPHENTLEQMRGAWNPDIMDILILLQPTQSMVLTRGVGDYDIDENGRAIRSLNQTGTHMFTSMRINSPRIFDGRLKGDKFSYLELLDKAEKQGRLYGITHKGDWHHISTPEDLARVETHYANTEATEKATAING